jgi:hypothetical protein
MELKVKHIGLQVSENDIQSFYVQILGFTIRGNFHLLEQEAYELFGIKKTVEIVYGRCGELDLELFIADGIQKSFSHLCLSSNKASEMYQKAVESGYNCTIRKETYFIRDTNTNVFELKDNNHNNYKTE